jgi:hypothetical protein
MGTGLVLLNYGIDELGNPRLRDVANARRLGGRRSFPADPTPVLRPVVPYSARLPVVANGSWSAPGPVTGAAAAPAKKRP